MAYPKQSDIEIPLLKEIHKAEGKAEPKHIYGKVAKYFPKITEEDLERKMLSHPSIYKWHNNVQWVRQKLVQKGQVDGSTRGVWKITELGIERLGLKAEKKEEIDEKPTMLDLLDDNEASIKEELKLRLSKLTPHEFENFAKKLLEAVDFSDVEITSVSKDGGIDGYGKLRQGVVKINAAFQCKRWKNVVSRPEIDKFRGSISGQFDQGVFITTSKFSKEAQNASIRKGAVPIILIDGEKILNFMIEYNLGVEKRPLYFLDIDEDFFSEED